MKINVKLEDFKAIIKPRYGTEIEFLSIKNCFKLPYDLWKAVSAFANTDGGMVVLGARESAEGLTFDFSYDEATLKLYFDEFWKETRYMIYPDSGLFGEADGQIVLKDLALKPYPVRIHFIVIHVPKARPEQKPVHLAGNPFGNVYARRNGQNCACDKAEVRQMFIEAVDAELGPSAQESRKESRAAETQEPEKQAADAQETERQAAVPQKEDEIGTAKSAAEAAEGLPESLTGKLADVYSYVKAHPHATSGDLAEVIQLSRESAKKYLQRLSAMGLVAAEGANKNRRYVAK